MEQTERVARERLLRRAVLAGDAAAWRAWYDESAGRLAAYVRWRCAGLDDLADEVLQEAWLTAVRRVRRFDPAQAPFAAWLAGIAANVLRNHLRRHRRRARVTQPLGAEPAAAEGPCGETERERRLEVARTLAELPPHYEAVLRAKYLDGKSVSEIAADRGESAKAVESLLTRARNAFRAAFRLDEQPQEPA
jgi:RNA polymerase sigma-70 factor, ECF subfamily